MVINKYEIDWSKAPRRNYTRTKAIIVLGSDRIRYEFDNGTAAEYRTFSPAAVEAGNDAEWCRQRGALVSAA